MSLFLSKISLNLVKILSTILNSSFLRISESENKNFMLSLILPSRQLRVKGNNRNTRTRCEIYSKLIITTPERRHRCQSGIFFVDFEHILQLFLVFLSLTLGR